MNLDIIGKMYYDSDFHDLVITVNGQLFGVCGMLAAAHSKKIKLDITSPEPLNYNEEPRIFKRMIKFFYFNNVRGIATMPDERLEGLVRIADRFEAEVFFNYLVERIRVSEENLPFWLQVANELTVNNYATYMRNDLRDRV